MMPAMTATQILVIGRTEVERLLPMERCIELMGETLAALSRGEAVNPLRAIVRIPEGPNMLGLMPAALSKPPAFGAKLISVFPENRAAGLESHQGFVALFESEHGRPVALVDASAVTAIRTAAVSAVATRALANPGAGDLALLGSGTQARSHLSAMLAIRPIRRVRAWSPDRERLTHFAADAGTLTGFEVEAADSAQAAVDSADLVCTVTAAREPILHGAWLSAGCHVNAVGSSTPAARELDADAVRRARFFVDRRESALAESGDILAAIRDGAVDERHIVGDIGDVLNGTVTGRREPREITLFKSLGLGVEDLAAAYEVLVRAREAGAGTAVSW
jgi:ornithine cyclodeaminase/alanine dehydrogenase-like protein (mu-crystallin family)